MWPHVAEKDRYMTGASGTRLERVAALSQNTISATTGCRQQIAFVGERIVILVASHCDLTLPSQ